MRSVHRQGSPRDLLSEQNPQLAPPVICTTRADTPVGESAGPCGDDVILTVPDPAPDGDRAVLEPLPAVVTAPVEVDLPSLRCVFIDDEPPNRRIGSRYLTQLRVPSAQITLLSDGMCVCRVCCAVAARSSLLVMSNDIVQARPRWSF